MDKNNNGVKSNIYLFYGEEKYDLNKSIEKIKGKFENLTLGVNLFYITKENIQELFSICDSITFFGEEKLVIIKNTNLKFDVKKMLSNVNDSTIVVIVEDEVDKRTSEYKELAKTAQVTEFEALDSKTMTSYIIQVLKQYNLNISYENAEYMVQICGTDKTNNINELKKIVAYTKTGEVTKDIVDKVCVKTLNAKIFDVLNKVINKDKKQALNELDQILMLKEPIVKISIMLYKQIKQMYMIKYLKQMGNKDIATALQIHPFVYRNLSISCDKYSLDELKKLIYIFDEYDEASKKGEIDFEVGLKKIICLM
ncbi:MAG: DNA polymerase III subunit delta [Clostridia bacterium]|nr:DNA polymerase III subunit delta [Clostridia bacterium]